MYFTKLLIVQLLLILSIGAYSQVGNAIVTPNSQGIAYLYKDSRSHNIVDSIVNDSVNEVYYCVSIIRATKKRAMVSTFIDDGTFAMHQGWIDWEYLGIRLNGDAIAIRCQPCAISKIRSMINLPYWKDIYPINRAQSGWIYIKDFKRSIVGWVEPKDQCANPYTTCN